MHRLVHIFLLLSFAMPVAAQLQPISNQQIFKTEDGLPQSLVTGVVQDKNGFIWVGTQDGIARYDGRSFKTITKKETGQTGFRSHVITNMAYNENDHITIVYQGGNMDDFDPVTFAIKPVTGGKRKLPPVRQGIIRGSTVDNLINFSTRPHAGQGVNWTDPITGKEMYAGTSNGKLKNDTICGMTSDKQGNIIIVTPSGVEISKNGGQHFEQTAFRIPYDSSLFFFKEMLVLPDHSLIMRYKNCLARIDITQKSVSIINTPAANASKRILANYMNTDRNGRLYFEQLGGVYRMEHSGELKLLWQSTLGRELNITACFIDRDDVLWVSPNAQGLYRVNLLPNAFQSYAYENGFFKDVMQQAGIPSSILPSHWFANKRHYNFYTAYDRDSLLYLCFGQGDSTSLQPNIFYRKEKQLYPLKFPAATRSIFRGLSVSAKDEIWVGDALNKGLWYWKNKTASPEFFQLDTTGNFRIIADLKSVGDQVWISTHGNGLLLFENGKLKENTTLYDIKVLPDNLTDICINPTNPKQLWIGSRGEGLILFDTEKGVRKIFTTEDGLPNNTIYCIVADLSGMLWLSTNKGICRFDPKDFSSIHYVKTDGLAGNEFNRYHKFIFTDGRIAFGGLDGFSVFRPSSFTGRKEPLKVPIRITQIDINNIRQDFTNPKALVREPLTQLKELVLPYNKNYLSVEFAAMQFNEPLKIRYRYMLKGGDQTWHESGSNNIATYTQLRPGHYTLLMNATGLNGVWSDEVATLKIIIRPPFWANWWAYSFYIIVALLLMRLYFRYHKKRLKEQQQLAFRQKEAERLQELDAVKDRFFSNITHEFRTPLTLILTPLEKLQQDKTLPEKTNNSLKTISRNAKQLLRLVNEFLDFSKLNKGQMNLSLSHGDFAAFVSGIVQQFEQAAEEKEIQLNFSADGVEGIYLFDEEKWEKVLFNLVGNALKFTQAGGTVNVVLIKKENNLVELKVMDSGIGISPDHLPYIFDRFYQADSSDTRSYMGTGIGLALVKELVELMHGTIRVESKPGSGSSFIIQLPVEALPAGSVKPEHLVPTTATLSESPAPYPSAEHDQPLILVVEDNQELQQFLAEGFTEEWKVITASDGLQGWDMILSEMPDVVISDLMMPGRNGIELCQLCKRDARTGHIGFMILTSRAAHDVKLKGLETGADDYIVKPFHLDELQLRVSNLLQLQQKQREFLQSQALPPQPGQILPQISDAFIRQLYQLLDEHLDDPQLNVDYLARNLSMSRSSLNRKLKNLLDISANDLIRRYRLQQAAAMLLTGNDITTTAYKAGFNTPSYFSQCFKEQYGMTPSEYIASLRS